jgi:hypothetical protein
VWSLGCRTQRTRRVIRAAVLRRLLLCLARLAGCGPKATQWLGADRDSGAAEPQQAGGLHAPQATLASMSLVAAAASAVATATGLLAAVDLVRIRPRHAPRACTPRARARARARARVPPRAP